MSSGPRTDGPAAAAPAELEAYLHAHIPLSRAMGVSVDAASPTEVVLRAPLEPNINHRETVFGGSASAVAILAAWSVVSLRLWAEGLSPRLVIQRNTMHYDAPISGAFTAVGQVAQEEDWPRFLALLKRRGRARIAARAVLMAGGTSAGRFEGDFVALLPERTDRR